MQLLNHPQKTMKKAQILQTRMYLRLMIISLTIHCPSLKMERSLVPWDR